MWWIPLVCLWFLVAVSLVILRNTVGATLEIAAKGRRWDVRLPLDLFLGLGSALSYLALFKVFVWMGLV